MPISARAERESQTVTAILDELGHVKAAATGISVRKRIFLDAAGRVTARHAMPQTQISWDRVFLAVQSCVPAGRYLTDHTLLKAEQDGNAAWLSFADGTVEYADRAIGADGIGSESERVLVRTRGRFIARGCRRAHRRPVARLRTCCGVLQFKEV
jgi:2-polyprenyl-6-methoxyphenol hydroxylase-like FAD-dependent oxidoreductase